MTTKPLAHSLAREEWEGVCAEWGFPKFRASQIWQGLHVALAETWDAVRGLPADLRGKLKAAYDLNALEVVEKTGTGARKFLLKCRDGNYVEAVLIPSSGRNTLCVSSQVGCAFGCAFCASGAKGCERDLEAGEIVAQAVVASRLLRHEGAALGRPENVVVMGMGEPFANYNAVFKALRILNAADGLNIGARHITVSTCGVVPGIERMAGEGMQIELSVSLHAPCNELRSRLMPVNKRWPLEALLAACRAYTEKTGRVITFEYTLVAGVNDSPRHAREVAKLLRGTRGRVNLIPLSPVEGFAGAAPTPRACADFLRELERAGLNATLRQSRGGEVDAACGQLRLRRGADLQ